MKILETERLIIKTATEEDSQFFLQLLNSPNWLKFIGNSGIKSEQDAINYIQSKLINSYKINGYGLYKMSTKNSTPIGICGFVKRDYLDHADIGFAILPEYEGNGYTYEACIELIKYGKTKLNLTPILAITSPENIKSCHLLNKIGLHQIGKVQPNKTSTELLLFSNETNN